MLRAAVKLSSSDATAPSSVPMIAICSVSISSDTILPSSAKSGGHSRARNRPISGRPVTRSPKLNSAPRADQTTAAITTTSAANVPGDGRRSGEARPRRSAGGPGSGRRDGAVLVGVAIGADHLLPGESGRRAVVDDPAAGDGDDPVGEAAGQGHHVDAAHDRDPLPRGERPQL